MDINFRNLFFVVNVKCIEEESNMLNNVLLMTLNLSSLKVEK